MNIPAVPGGGSTPSDQPGGYDGQVNDDEPDWTNTDGSGVTAEQLVTVLENMRNQNESDDPLARYLPVAVLVGIVLSLVAMVTD